MKHIFTLSIIAISAVTLSCEKREAPKVLDFEPVGRVVAGKLYEINDPRWKTLAEWENLGLQYLGPSGHNERLVCSVHTISGNVVFVDIDNLETRPDNTGVEQKIGSYYQHSVVILNYPDPSELITGHGISCTCMRTTNYIDKDGHPLVAYDCGTTNGF
jgi:hypothetical protein